MADDPRKERFNPYLRDLADRMGLKDWKVRVVDDQSAHGSLASMLMIYGQKTGIVKLSELFLKEDPEEQRSTLVHELIHLHFAPMDGLAEDWLEEDQYQGFTRMMEYGVDALALVLAEHLPLPPGGDEEPSDGADPLD